MLATDGNDRSDDRETARLLPSPLGWRDRLWPIASHSLWAAGFHSLIPAYDGLATSSWLAQWHMASQRTCQRNSANPMCFAAAAKTYYTEQTQSVIVASIASEIAHMANDRWISQLNPQQADHPVIVASGARLGTTPAFSKSTLSQRVNATPLLALVVWDFSGRSRPHG